MLSNLRDFFPQRTLLVSTPHRIMKLPSTNPNTDPKTERTPLVTPDTAPDFKVVKIENAGEEAWSGIAQVDANGDRWPSWLSTAILVLGDAAVYLIFATTGRTYHEEGVTVMKVLSTMLPFYFGWLASALMFGGYGPNARSGRIAPAAWTAFGCWLVGTPLGLGLHGLAVGHVPPLVFVKVNVIFTFFSMMGWRIAFAAIMPAVEDPGKAADEKRRGNPFEFLSFLTSITKRW